MPARRKPRISAVIAAVLLLGVGAPAFADGQAAIQSDSTTNLSSSLNAGTASQEQSAYTAAAGTASNISQQDQQQAQQLYGDWQTDLSNASYWNSQAQAASSAAASATDSTTVQQDQAQAAADAAQAAYWTGKAQQDDNAYQAWLAAANGAQAVSDQQTAQAQQQAQIAQQSQSRQQSSYGALMEDYTVAQGDTASSASSSGSSAADQGLSNVASQTSVTQGQVQGSASSAASDVGYLAAAAAPQVAMTSMALGEQTANIAAVQAYQNAQACAGWNPGPCIAYWMSVNASEQATANSLYGAQMAAAPVLAVTYIGAATAAAKQSFDSIQQQIGSMTGVTQQTSSSLPSTVGQTPYTVSNDTSYQTVGQAQNSQQVSDAQTNTNATWQGAQDWSNGVQYQTQANAAQTIQNQDLAAAQSATDPGAQQAWQGAASIAGQQASQYGAQASAYQTRLQADQNLQNSSASAVQSDTTGQAAAMDSAAAQSAINSFSATMQSINTAVAGQ